MSEGPQRPEVDASEQGATHGIDKDGEAALAVDGAVEGTAEDAAAAPPEPAPDAAEPAAAVPASPPPPGRSGGGRGVALFALLLVFLLLAALGYPAWLIYQGEDLLARIPSAQMSQLQARVASLDAELADSQRQGTAREAELERSVAALSQAFSSLSAAQASESPIDDRQWRLAETAYLLRVANLRVRMEGDRAGGEALLRAADELLAEIDDFGLFPVREAIAESLAALRLAPAVDRVGLYLKLEGLGEQIAGLPLDVREFSAEVAPVDATTMTWDENLRQRFAGLVDFRIHRPAPVRAMVAPNETQFLRHNLALKFEQAQLALLQGDAVVWRDALSESGQWIEDYFDLDHPAAQQLRAAIAELETERVDVRPPDISAPLTELLRLRGRGSFLDPIAAPRPSPGVGTQIAGSDL